MANSYLIDGYNLIHALGMIERRVAQGQVLEQARRRLLDFLTASFPTNAALVTIVFDARKAPSRVARQQRYHHLHVYFAAGNQSADDLIECMIEEEDDPQTLIVISNDSRLQQAARRRGAQAWAHTDLLDFLDQRSAQTKPDAQAEEKADQPMSEEERRHWLEEFQDLESDPEFKEFFEMDRFDDEGDE